MILLTIIITNIDQCKPHYVQHGNLDLIKWTETAPDQILSIASTDLDYDYGLAVAISNGHAIIGAGNEKIGTTFMLELQMSMNKHLMEHKI